MDICALFRHEQAYSVCDRTPPAEELLGSHPIM